jgi:hypothetical protein
VPDADPFSSRRISNGSPFVSSRIQEPINSFAYIVVEKIILIVKMIRAFEDLNLIFIENSY